MKMLVLCYLNDEPTNNSGAGIFKTLKKLNLM